MRAAVSCSRGFDLYKCVFRSTAVRVQLYIIDNTREFLLVILQCISLKILSIFVFQSPGEFLEECPWKLNSCPTIVSKETRDQRKKLHSFLER